MLDSQRFANLISVSNIMDAHKEFEGHIKGYVNLQQENYLFVMSDESVLLVNQNLFLLSPFDSLIDLAITWRLKKDCMLKDFPGLDLNQFVEQDHE